MTKKASYDDIVSVINQINQAKTAVDKLDWGDNKMVSLNLQDASVKLERAAHIVTQSGRMMYPNKVF